jgi:threonine/homoserine/homoserine lactone efflux protein
LKQGGSDEAMNAPAPLPGWYPDPSGAPGQRYWDGQQWTAVPPPPVQQPIVINNVVGSNMAAPTPVFVRTGPNHALHLVLTLLTCGMWAPVWLIVSIVSIASGPQGVGQPNYNGLKVVGAVIGGLFLLGIAIAHWPQFLGLAGLAGLGYLGYLGHKRHADRRAQQAQIAARADTQNQAFMSGDPSGIYGQYPPPPPQQ